MVKQSSRRKNL